MVRSAKRERTELHSRAEAKHCTVELRHRSVRTSHPEQSHTGRGARTSDHRGQDPRPFQACSFHFHSQAGGLKCSIQACSLAPPNGGGWSPSTTCGGGSCSFFLSKGVGGGVFLRLAEGSGPSCPPSHRLLCNRLPGTRPFPDERPLNVLPSLPLVRSIRMWMLACCDLRWMHGPVVAVANPSAPGRPVTALTRPPWAILFHPPTHRLLRNRLPGTRPFPRRRWRALFEVSFRPCLRTEQVAEPSNDGVMLFIRRWSKSQPSRS